jgi:Phage tail fibre repeat
MSNTLRIKRRISGNLGAPSTLSNAELAYNEVDNILYYGKGDDGGGLATSVIGIAGDGLHASLTSPTFVGVPVAPTAAQGNSTTQIATTAFVNAEIAADATPLSHVGSTGATHGNASGSVAGFMSSADKTKLDGVAVGANTGTVTSIALSLPSEFSVAGSPVTTSGTFTVTKASQTEKTVYAAPNGAPGLPSFRSLLASDIPTLNQNTTGTASNVTGTVAIANGGTGTNTAEQALSAFGGAPLASPAFTGVPTAPTANNGTSTTQLATTAFVAAAVNSSNSGVDPKESVRVATVSAGTLASSFVNGAMVDGITLSTNDRILIKDQATGSENGLYTVNASGAPTRSTDADDNAEVTAGLYVFVESGTENADTGWILITDGSITLNTTALSFVKFTGAGVITAGNGLTKTGSNIDVVTADSSRIAVSADSIDLATVSQTDSSGTAGINFVQTISKDSYGRVTGRVIADVRAGTTAQTGILQLTDSISSISTTTAATPNSVKTAYDLAGTKQPLDATLTALANLSVSADTLFYGSGADAFSSTTLTSFMRTLLDDTSAAVAQSTLGIGNMSFDGGTF